MEVHKNRQTNKQTTCILPDIVFLGPLPKNDDDDEDDYIYVEDSQTTMTTTTTTTTAGSPFTIVNNEVDNSCDRL